MPQVTFKQDTMQSRRIYKAGEVADLPPEIAERMIAGGFAVDGGSLPDPEPEESEALDPFENPDLGSLEDEDEDSEPEGE